MRTQTSGETTTGLPANIEAALCYALGFLTGILFCVIEKKSKYVRFHAIQSTAAFGAIAVLQLVFSRLPLLRWVLVPCVGLVSLVLWVFLMIKAVQGESFSLPWAGEIAKKNA